MPAEIPPRAISSRPAHASFSYCGIALSCRVILCAGPERQIHGYHAFILEKRSTLNSGFRVDSCRRRSRPNVDAGKGST